MGTVLKYQCQGPQVSRVEKANAACVSETQAAFRKLSDLRKHHHNVRKLIQKSHKLDFNKICL
jgi:hypothetical protein